jgi:predicted restriction endonuclease
MGYSSLFNFCVKELGYAESEASIKVGCVRIINRHPEVKNKLEEGTVAPTTAAKLNSFFHKNDLDKNQQKELIEECSGKSTRQAEAIINNLGEVSKETKITLNERLIRKIKKLSALLENAEREEHTIEIALDMAIEKLEAEKVHRQERGSSRQRYITRKAKEAVNARAGGRCEFVNKVGMRCDCRTNLQYDHIRPVAQGGNSSAGNLQKLCFAHNQLRAKSSA